MNDNIKYPPQYKSIALARRWAKTVDYASPISSWTDDMHEILHRNNGNKIEASKILQQKRFDEDQ
jgi:hypothetical protein